MSEPLHPSDEDAIMAACGPAVSIILREAIDSGFFEYQRSRDRDPTAHAVYRPTTRANILVDHIYPFLQQLTTAADPDGLHLRARDTDNGRATELWIGDFGYAKVKRVHDIVRLARFEEDLEVDGETEIEIVEYGLPRNIRTARVRDQLYPFAPVLPGLEPLDVADDASNRLCLICAFDLEAVTEDAVVRPRIGVCDENRWWWSQVLPQLPADAIGAVSPSLADVVVELRQARGA